MLTFIYIKSVKFKYFLLFHIKNAKFNLTNLFIQTTKYFMSITTLIIDHKKSIHFFF